MIYLILWILFSLLLLGFTLARPHPYRFTRFIAFESLISLVFLNAGDWFLFPGSARQILSWVLLLISIALAGIGFRSLKNRGRPEGDFEDTTRLITDGIYRYIRHPMYASLVFFAAGAFLKAPSWVGALLVAANLLGVEFTARIEERHNLDRFGEEYSQYCRLTKKFIPFIY